MGPGHSASAPRPRPPLRELASRPVRVCHPQPVWPSRGPPHQEWRPHHTTGGAQAAFPWRPAAALLSERGGARTSRAEVTARRCPAGGDPRPGVHRGSRRGASTLASGGAKRHQTSLCSFPRIRAPRGLQGAQGSPETRSTLRGLAPQARRQAVLMQRFHRRPRRAGVGRGERGAGGGRGPRRHSPEPRLVPRQPRRQTQPFSGWAPLVGEPGCGRVAGGGAALTGGPPVPGAGALLPPRAGRAEPRARPSHAGRSRPSAAGPQTPASTFPGTSWACDPPRGSAGGRSSTWGSARRHLLGSREH